MTPVLEVKSLCTRFHTRDGVLPVVDGVSFTLQRGRVLGLVGEGLGVALVPSLAQAQHDAPGVRTMSLDPVARRRVVGVTTPDLARVPSVAAVLDALRVTAAGV